MARAQAAAARANARLLPLVWSISVRRRLRPATVLARTGGWHKNAQILYWPAWSSSRTCAPVARTLSVIGGKWKPTILFHLHARPRRFNELRRLMPQITRRMLTLQLRALEEDRIMARTVHDTVPPQVEYALTGYGETLGPLIEALQAWGERHARRPA